MQRKEFFDLLSLASSFGWIYYEIPTCQKDFEKVRIIDIPDGHRGITLAYRGETWYGYHLLSGEVENFGKHEPQLYNTDIIYIYSDTRIEKFLEALKYK
jgi:hypothetical protein